MRKNFLYLFIFLLIAFIGLVLKDIFSLYLKDYSFLIPNISVCLFVYLGFYEHQLPGLILSLLIGLLTDISGGILIGPWAFVGILIFLMLSVYAPRIFMISRSSISFAVFLSSLIAIPVFYFMTGIATDREFPSLGMLAAQVISNTIFGPMVFGLIDWLSNMRTFRFLRQQS